MLAESTLTTPNCDNVRTAEYPAELQLFYTYSVEINDDLLLYDMERAIDNAVMMELDMCDVKGRPVYKVRTSTAHSFSTSRTCAPTHAGNTCMVVNGETAVLLDESSDANFVRDKVFVGIYHGLADVSFLNGFTTSVVSAELIAEGHASLVEISDLYHEQDPEVPSGVTTTVAVAAASVTIVVASMFCYGFMRRPNSRDPSVRHRNRSIRKPSARAIVGERSLRRHQFVRLEDLSASTFAASISPRSFHAYNVQDEEAFVQDYDEEEYYTEVNYNPAINMSVSDITSDSNSLRSGVSRTPSMLERIEEEIEDEDDEMRSYDDNDDDDKSCNFSYSEDSTIITNALSKAGLVSPEDLEEILDNDASKVLDLSDLDPCFTILPENTDELFRDLEDLSESTHDSPLESVVLEMRLGSDCDSFQTALSDATMISLPPTWDFESREGSESSSLKSLMSIKNNASPIRKQQNSDSFCTAIDESPIRAVNPNEESTEMYGTPSMAPVSTQEDETESMPRNEILPTVSDSEEELFHSEVESEIDDIESQCNASISSAQSSDKKDILQPIPSMESDEIYISEKNTPVIEKVASTGDDTEGTVHSSVMNDEEDDNDNDDDDAETKICSVDSIDEWVHELMNQGPKNSECTDVSHE